MKAFLLAAGKGERMRPLTEHLPKPLLPVLENKTLLDFQLARLFGAGISEVIINTAYLGHKIRDYLSTAPAYQDKNIVFSQEPEPLETAGALTYALDMLGDDPFLLVNGDVWIDLDYSNLVAQAESRTNLAHGGGHLVLVDNPAHNRAGDFMLAGERLRYVEQDSLIHGLTFSGVSILSPNLIRQYPERRRIFPLREVFAWGIKNDLMTGEKYQGYWLDVGTPERLDALRGYLSDRNR